MEKQFTVHLGDKGRVVIPSDLRIQAGIVEGTELLGRVDEEGRIVLETREALKRRVQSSAAEARTSRKSVVDSLLADRKREGALRAGKRPKPSRPTKARART
jgi:AbrB family looped-hinge helix DNA binding protein